MAAVADPAGQRLVASLARPGANVTGRSSQAEDLVPKKLELFARALGKPATVAVLVDSNSAVHARMFEALLPAARHFGRVWALDGAVRRAGRPLGQAQGAPQGLGAAC